MPTKPRSQMTPEELEKARAYSRDYERKKRSGQASTKSPPQNGPTITTEPPPTVKPRVERKRKSTAREVDDVTLRGLHETVSLVVGFAGVVLIPDPNKRMTESEQEAIFYPLERMYLRHASVPEISPDTADMTASAMALFAYLMRIGALNAILPRFSRAASHPGARAGRQTASSHGGNGRGMGGSAPGADTGSRQRAGTEPVQETGPRTPEQILEQLARDSAVPEPAAD